MPSAEFLAQARPATNQAGEILPGVNVNTLGPSLINLGIAVAILVIGWLIATIAAAVTGGLLKRTNIDNRLAGWVTGRPDGPDGPQVEKWISTAVFWVIMIFVLVAFFNQLDLPAVSEPLNTFLTQVTGFLPKLVGALILLAIAWVVATISKMVITRGLRAFGLDERLNRQVGSTPGSNQLMLSDTLGNALYWFIFLLFLSPILDTLGLQQALAPVQNLLNQILSALPRIIEAIIIAAAGWLLAQVVRRIVTNLLAATGTDRLGARFGVSQTTGGQSLSWIIGTIVYVLILIPTAIAALNALGIEAISRPAISMLTQILNAIPQIFTAALILIGAYILGRFVADLVTNILTGLGFNNIFRWLGLDTRPVNTGRPVTPPLDPNIPPDYQQQTVIQDTTPASTTRTPSEFVGIVVLVGIMLLATVAATNILNIVALTAIVTGLVIVAGRILAGLVVFAIGLYFANLAFSLITSSGSRQARILGQIARIAIIALVSAMALQQMGIASNIVNLAFGLLLGAIAVALALSFGLGGREVASQQIREWLAEFKERK
ncbi:mechanosensitive ion channel [Microcoleus sp. FACHB-68]|uniref:mechanosensitive ion channel n=1 Tax=Microcoleus sp. FACHB-68 TaxID=2692826 RepID=UPI001F55231C|nr:mechanosensitive ion channel [Microcoleus sp. FACHB-68]